MIKFGKLGNYIAIEKSLKTDVAPLIIDIKQALLNSKASNDVFGVGFRDLSYLGNKCFCIVNKDELTIYNPLYVKIFSLDLRSTFSKELKFNIEKIKILEEAKGINNDEFALDYDKTGHIKISFITNLYSKLFIVLKVSKVNTMYPWQEYKISLVKSGCNEKNCLSIFERHINLRSFSIKDKASASRVTKIYRTRGINTDLNTLYSPAIEITPLGGWFRNKSNYKPKEWGGLGSTKDGYTIGNFMGGAGSGGYEGATLFYSTFKWKEGVNLSMPLIKQLYKQDGKTLLACNNTIPIHALMENDSIGFNAVWDTAEENSFAVLPSRIAAVKVDGQEGVFEAQDSFWAHTQFPFGNMFISGGRSL